MAKDNAVARERGGRALESCRFCRCTPTTALGSAAIHAAGSDAND